MATRILVHRSPHRRAMPRNGMRQFLPSRLVCAFLVAPTLCANALPLPDKDVAAIAREVDGEAAMQTLEGIVQQHRERGSRGFHASADWVAGRARSFGLENVEILRFPADGKIFYGT